MDRWRGAMAEHVDHARTVVDLLAGERPMAFDPAAFVADLRGAGCQVVLSAPGTCFRRDDEVATYFIRPSPGYSDVMLRWHEALAACPDHVAQVVAHLTAANGWEA